MPKDIREVDSQMIQALNFKYYKDKENYGEFYDLINESGADVNFVDPSTGETPIVIAARFRNPELVSFLLEKGAIIPNDIIIKMEGDYGAKALGGNEIEVLKLLMANSQNLSIVYKDGNTLLMNAANSRLHPEFLDMVYDRWPEAINMQNNEGQTALMFACGESSELTRKLLDHGADPNIFDNQGRSAILYSNRYASETEIKQMVGNLERWDIDQRTHIEEKDVQKFLKKYSPELVEKFVELKRNFRHGDRLEKLEKDGIKLISKYEVKQIVDDLISHGADIKARNKKGETPLMIVDRDGPLHLRDELLRVKANKFELTSQLPKYFTDPSQAENISKNENWNFFANLIIQAVKNKDKYQYPLAKFNKGDNSVSFLLSDEQDEKSAENSFVPDYSKNFLKTILSEDVKTQMEYLVWKNGFKTIGGKELFEIVDNGQDVELRINLAPENLDEILKLNDTYIGYRNSGGIMELKPTTKLKDDKIMLFPVYVDDSRGKVMSAGCQFFEIPTLQLMQSLPNYETEILPNHQKNGFYFHWVPKEVSQELLIDRANFNKILEMICSENGIKVDPGESPDFITIDNVENSAISIVPADKIAQDFYVKYGNCSARQTQNFSSVEIEKLKLFEGIKNYWNKQLEGGKELETHGVEKIGKVIETLDKMIEKEKISAKSSDEKSDKIDSPSPSVKSAAADPMVKQETKQFK